MSKPTKETVKNLSDETRKTLRKNKYHLKEVHIKKIKENKYPDYSKSKLLNLFQGYDFLEKQLFVRYYLCKKYNLDRTMYLDVLTFLFARNIFSIKDYSNVRPFRFTLAKIKILIDWGLVQIEVHDANPEKQLYKLTSHAKSIVKEYYKLLVGEKIFPNYEKNICNSETKSDKIKYDVLKKINQYAPSESQKRLWSTYKEE